MAAEAPLSSLTDLDPLFCPACSDEYQALPSPSVPMLYSCSHNICKACVDARELGDELGCAVCGKVGEPPVVDVVLAGFCSDRKLRASGVEVPDAVAEVVSAIAEADVSSGPGPTNEELRALAARCRELAAALLKRSEAVTAAKKIMFERTEASCVQYTAAMDKLHADIDVHRTGMIAKANEMCQARCKTMDAEMRELTVSAGQLRTCAAICKSVKDMSKKAETLAYADRALEAFSGLGAKSPASVRIELTVNEAVVAELLSKLTKMRDVVIEVRHLLGCYKRGV